jgi:hypothetical protein
MKREVVNLVEETKNDVAERLDPTAMRRARSVTPHTPVQVESTAEPVPSSPHGNVSEGFKGLLSKLFKSLDRYHEDDTYLGM